LLGMSGGGYPQARDECAVVGKRRHKTMIGSLPD
jgi:hypothetical protein